MTKIVELLRTDYGLDPTRGGMVRALVDHVEARLAALALDEDAYVERLRSDIDERRRLIHVVTVRHSWFYRDPVQLDGLAESLARRYAEHPGRPLELWVAGCAGGEEAWTVAMLALERQLPLRVHASDVDGLALDGARAGVYGAWSLRELPERLWGFMELAGDERWCVAETLRSSPLLDIEFVEHNLCGPPPSRQFDFISCRNVLIYFEPERAQAVVAGLRQCLRSGGELVLGAGDLLFRIGEQPARARVVNGPVRPGPQSKTTVARETEPTSRADAARLLRPPKPQRALPAPRPRAALVSAPPRVVEPPKPVSTALTIIDEAKAQLGRAGAAVESGNYAVALEQLGPLVEADPLSAEAHLWAGIAHYGLGQDQAAAEALRRARCLEPHLWPATLFAALTNERRGLWAAATRCWTELGRIMEARDAPPVEGTSVLLEAIPHWRSEALALARQRVSKHADARSHD